MPTYVYQAESDDNCAYCVAPFERRQKISDPAIKSCPECGSPVRRVITPPALTRTGPNMSEDNIGKKGFTQYKKLEKGVYEKTAGKGPDIITDKD